MNAMIVVGLALVAAAPAPKEEAKKPANNIVGEWHLEKLTAMGQEVPIPGGKGMGFRFLEDGALVLIRDGMEDPKRGRYTVDLKKSPAHLNIIPPEKDDKPMPAIFKVEGDTLTICGIEGAADTERPTEFSAPAGKQAMLIVLKKAK